jgi:hypothetical protein
MALSYRGKKAEVLSHWFTVIDGLSASSEEFYGEVEKELKARRVPGLTMTRVEFAEGGALSDKRVYLRMMRERLVFDCCAAPFGRAYFYSIRFAEVPAKVEAWQIAVCAVAIIVVAVLAVKILGLAVGSLSLAALLAGTVWTLRNAISVGLEDLDASLVKSPLLGPLYERFLRAESYYRHDTRLLYQEIVSEVVKKKVEEVTAAKGATLVKAYEHSPILDGLYRPVTPSS